MTRWISICFVAIIIAFAAWVWHGSAVESVESLDVAARKTTTITDTSSVIKPTPAKITPQKREWAAENGDSTRSIVHNIVASYECSDCEDSPFVAHSPGEAAWMQSRGFPTHEQLEHMDSLDQAKLRAAADQGNLVAMGLYGEILLKQGQRNDGINYLFKALDKGSVYAAYGLSESKMPPQPFADKYAAASYIRLAYLLGDSRASDYLYKHFAGYDNGEWEMIDRDASMYFRRLREAQAKKFGTPPPILPRPPTPEGQSSDQ